MTASFFELCDFIIATLWLLSAKETFNEDNNAHWEGKYYTNMYRLSYVLTVRSHNISIKVLNL